MPIAADRPPAVPEHLRRHRSAQARGARAWTADEISKVVDLYPDYAAMQAALPHRSRAALYAAAGRWAARRKRHTWKITENTRLKRMWKRASREELCEAFPLVSWNAIRCHATQTLRCGPRRRRFVEFDAGILDSIRRRAEDEGHSLVELDRLAGTGRYFQRSKRRIVLKHVWKAIIALGGTLDVDWNDEA